IVAQIRQVRKRQLTPVDLRALDLLEVVIERRSAEVLNKSGPHVDACLAALKRVFEHAWGEGEPQLMARFLRSLGKLPQEPLVKEQLRQLDALIAMLKPGSRDHLIATDQRCALLFWQYERKEESLATMEAEIRACLQAHAGKWPYADIGILDNYLSLLTSL